MSTVLLLSTTALSMGFFWLIDKPIIAYIPLAICIIIICRGIRGLYRDSDERTDSIRPYLQEQSIRRVLTITLLRAINHRRNPSRPRVAGLMLTGYAGLVIAGIILDQKILTRQGVSGYLFAGLATFIAHQRDIVSLELLMGLIVSHRIIGMGLAHYRRTLHSDRTDALYRYLVYLGYASIVFVGFVILPHGIASIIVTILIGGLLISLPDQKLDVTPDTKPITAEDILQGKKIIDHQDYRTPSRYERIGIQPSHGTLLIRIIIAILTSNIFYQIITRYSFGQPSLLETIIFVMATIMSIVVCVIYYLSHRKDTTPTLRKTAVIILTNLAIGISIVHLFYPHTRGIIIGAITRNTANNLALRRIYRYHTHTLHRLEYHYRMIANITITVINSILILTRFHSNSRQTTIIILLIYGATQALLLHPTYQSFQK